MNAVLQPLPRTALDQFRDHKARVGRLHDTLAQFNPLTTERNQLGGAVAHAEVAISAARSTQWPDPQEIARLSVTLDAARAAADRFERKHRDDFARIAQLQRDYAALAATGKQFEAAAILEHAMTAGIESFADSAALWLEGYVEWAACWRAHHLACGRDGPGVPGLSLIVELPIPANAPQTAALQALRSARDLTQRIEARAREITTEIQSA